MEKNNMTKEKREALIDSILAETKNGTYATKSSIGMQTAKKRETVKKPDMTAVPDASESIDEPTPSMHTDIRSNSEENRIIEESRRTAEKIEKIRREKIEAQKARRADAEKAAIKAPKQESFTPETSDVYENDSETQRLKKSGWSVLNDILDIVQWVITVSFIIILVFTYILGFAFVSGGSMEPTLKDGDSLLVFSAGYSVETGDIVVIDDQKANLIDEDQQVIEKDGLGCKIVKRIIAKGGDTIDFDFENGIVYVNGEALEENYISEPTTRDEFAFEYPLTVPEGYVFVMGDNRNISKDSRHADVGLVSEDDIVGKVVLRIYPFDSFGGIE